MKKGVSLLALTAVIIVLSIVTSTVIITGGNASNNTKKMQFASELQSLQYKIREAELTDVLDEVLEPAVLIDDIMDVDFMEGATYERRNSSNRITLYPINLSNLGVDKASRGNKKEGDLDVYLYSKETEKVYYYLGNKIGGVKYYTLVPELDVRNTLTNYDYFPCLEDGTIDTSINGCRVYNSNDGFIKDESDTFYTIIEADDNVLDLTVSVQDSITQMGLLKCKNRVLYVLDCTGNAAKNGMDITVNHFENGEIFVSDYKVAKFDNLAPVIDKSKINIVYYSSDNALDVRLYYSEGAIKDAEDNGLVASGIKVMRYYFGEFPGTVEKLKKVSAPFTESGIEISNTSDVAKIYIYVEDYAGNYAYDYIEVSSEIMQKLKLQG